MTQIIKANGITSKSINTLDSALVENWREMRRHAIEIGLLAERNLIQMGVMSTDQRQVLTRKERRNQ